MKRLILVLALVVSACGGVGPLPSPTAGAISPNAETAIVGALGILQTSAIVFAPVDGFSQVETSAVIKWVGKMTNVVIAGATGWVSALDLVLAQLPSELSKATLATLQPLIDGVQAAIEAAYGTGLS